MPPGVPNLRSFVFDAMLFDRIRRKDWYPAARRHRLFNENRRRHSRHEVVTPSCLADAGDRRRRVDWPWGRRARAGARTPASPVGAPCSARATRRRAAGSSPGIDGHARGEPRPRSRSLCVTLLDSLDHEPGVSDDCGNVAREVTSVGESTLEWFEPTLPDDDPGVGGKAVLEKIETTSGTNHASQ